MIRTATDFPVPTSKRMGELAADGRELLADVAVDGIERSSDAVVRTARQAADTARRWAEDATDATIDRTAADHDHRRSAGRWLVAGAMAVVVAVGLAWVLSQRRRRRTAADEPNPSVLVGDTESESVEQVRESEHDDALEQRAAS